MTVVEGHPWFGAHRLPVAAPAQTVRDMLRHEIRDIGWPYQDQLPATPIAIPRASYAELFRVSAALLGLLRRTALETDPAVHRLPDRERRLFLRDEFLEERYADYVARPDIVIGPDGPQILEFNVSSALGGPVEMHCRLRVWRDLYGDHAFSYQDPFAVRAEMFRAIAAENALAPRVAIVGSARLVDIESRYFQLEADYYNNHGLTARWFEPDELPAAWDCPPHLRYPLGLRNFTNGDFVRDGVDLTPVQDALDHGCLLVTTQSSILLHSKLTLALLSAGRPWMTSAERRLVDRYVPWTRIVGDGKTSYRDRDVDLIPFVLENRERLVLKTALGESGNEVVLGREAAPPVWAAAVAAAVESATSVVQEFVEPRTCRLPILNDGSDDPEEVDIAPVFGPLLFGRRPAGLFARFFGDGQAGVVSVKGRHRTSSDSAVVAI